MVKEEIRIERVIVHILDTEVGMPVMSEGMLDFGSDLAEFLRDHIFRIASGDDSKECEFYKDQSTIYQMLTEYREDDFIENSQLIANELYEIMSANVEIPSADLVIVQFSAEEGKYLAVLKMNWKSSYTHKTSSLEEGNFNEIIRFKTILPAQTQRLTEAAVIDLQNFCVRLIEKKYEVNGEKTNYFSYLFLKCSAHLSHKSKLSIVAKAVEKVQNDHIEETQQYEEHMKAKSIILDELEENGGFVVEDLADKLFVDKPEMREAFQEKMENYNMVKEEVLPQSDRTIQKYQKQHLITDTGIELKIPMDQYKDIGKVEFITNEDGSISVMLKNIGFIQAKL